MNLAIAQSKGNLQRWLDALERVNAGEMPPAEDSQISTAERTEVLDFLRNSLTDFRSNQDVSTHNSPRRLNNREFENSIRDVLLLEDVGTHQPTANLLGDTLHHGFDTHGDTLGFSRFHLEQYIEAVRKIVDATILSGDQPPSQQIVVQPSNIFAEHFKQNITRPERQGKEAWFDFLDPRQAGRLTGFETVPESGRYRITIRATGIDRGIYSAKDSGIYPDDPIRLTVRMGDRNRVIDLPDNDVMEIELDEWLAAGTRLRLHHDTDGLKMRGNGNFKFQNAITGEFIRKTDPNRYAMIVAAIKPTKSGRVRSPESWHNWVDYWMGPRPRIFGAVIEGPVYDSWPPKRQIALIGADPKVEDAAGILEPIAERAWRRDVRPDELEPIVNLVRSKATELGDIEAMKEGIIAILVSPQFLLVNSKNGGAGERFASKFSYFLSAAQFRIPAFVRLWRKGIWIHLPRFGQRCSVDLISHKQVRSCEPSQLRGWNSMTSTLWLRTRIIFITIIERTSVKI